MSRRGAMRLFEAILETNARFTAGDKTADVQVPEFADSLPVVALTCIDVRLNPLMPAALGLPEEHFIWLRNAGNVITSTSSSTIRSLALACAVKGGREIAVIGHTDCRVGHTSIMELTERFRTLGVERAKLPENLVEFFGVFASERQNVLKAVDFVRHSPLIGPKIPVHGLLADIGSGKLEWLVNGYRTLEMATAHFAAALPVQQPTLEDAFGTSESPVGEEKLPAAQPGGPAAQAVDWLKEVKIVEVAAPETARKLKAEQGKPAPLPASPKVPPRSKPQPKPQQIWWK